MSETQDITKIIDDTVERLYQSEYNFQKCATRADRNGPYHIEDVVAAIVHSSGCLVEAAKLLGRRRVRLREFIWRTPEILEFFEDLFEGNLDLIERNYIQEALSGDLKVAKHILSTKGRNRGYGTQGGVVTLDPSVVPYDGFEINVVAGGQSNQRSDEPKDD